MNRRRLVQQRVFTELLQLIDPGTKPYQPARGRPNVIMLVGLQGAGKTTTCTKVEWQFRLSDYYSSEFSSLGTTRRKAGRRALSAQTLSGTVVTSCSGWKGEITLN